jgi:hypothetical protein
MNGYRHKIQIPLDPRKLNPYVSDDLSRLILICMEKAKERRYQAAEDLLRDLGKLESGVSPFAVRRHGPKLFQALFSRRKDH